MKSFYPLTTLLIGSKGQLGWELNRQLALLGPVTALDYPELDLGQPASLAGLVQRTAPDVVVNAAAYTAVDRAEQQADICKVINVDAPALLARAANDIGAAFIHFSTDYVFDGMNSRPYTEQDTPHPLSVYGRTKFDSEAAVTGAAESVWIFRTAWVYSNRQGGFVNKVLEWSRQQPTLKIVSDQISNPTWCRMLAQAVVIALLRGGQDIPAFIKKTRGLYHLAGNGYTSRLEWAKRIMALDPRWEQQITHEVLPAATVDFPTPARRPLFSALDCSRFKTVFGFSLPDWQISLELMMQEQA